MINFRKRVMADGYESDVSVDGFEFDSMCGLLVSLLL